MRSAVALLRGPAGAAADAGAGAATSSSLLQRLASQWATSLHDEKQHEDRAFSGSLCSTSGAGVQQRRCFAKKGSGGAAPKAAANAGAGGGSAPPAVGDDTSPPTYRAARPSRGDPLRQLPESQRKLLQALAPPGEKLRTPRQIGWDLGPAQSMALLHETLRDVAGAPVLYTPFVVTDIFQSAQAVAEWLKMVLELGEDFSSIERFFVQVLATEPRPDVRGIKVQIKGRLAGKGGKATKKVWQSGATSVANLDEPVDSAKSAAETSAGIIGIKVWIVYARKAIGPNFFSTRLKAPTTLQELLAMPRSAPVKASSSAWWAVPGPLQPAHVGAWAPYKPGVDPLLALGGGGGADAGAAGQEAGGESASEEGPEGAGPVEAGTGDARERVEGSGEAENYAAPAAAAGLSHEQQHQQQ